MDTIVPLEVEDSQSLLGAQLSGPMGSESGRECETQVLKSRQLEVSWLMVRFSRS
jgi:hypothetical protein